MSQGIPRLEEDQCTREANEDDGPRPWSRIQRDLQAAKKGWTTENTNLMVDHGCRF